MKVTISGKQITLRETKNTFTLNLTPIKGSKEHELLMSSKYAKKAYLVFPKSDSRITPENIQIWCDKKVIVTPIQDVKITEFFPTTNMLAYQALVELPNGRRFYRYIDLRGKEIETALKSLMGSIVTEIRRYVPRFKLIKSKGEGNFLRAAKEFIGQTV